MGWKTISCSVVLFLAAFAGNVSASDEGFDRAKSLYASAAYDEALVVLNQLSATPTLDDPLSIGAYRVYCLLALNRESEARALIDRILHQSPLFVPSANEASPHIQTIFREVRRATLPIIARERYSEAKTAFDRKDPLTMRQFDDLLTLLQDSDLRRYPRQRHRRRTPGPQSSRLRRRSNRRISRTRRPIQMSFRQCRCPRELLSGGRPRSRRPHKTTEASCGC